MTVHPSADKPAACSQPWLLRHYKICNHIYNLQSRQERYCEEVEMQAAVDAQIRSEEARYSVTEG